MIVIKRDNSEEVFQVEKIEKAIERAFESCGKGVDTSIVDCVVSNYDIDSDEKVHVEEIQDAVERCLMSNDKEVAKAYIIYRYEHKLIRENKDKLYKDITKKLMASDVQNQNANLDEHSFGGRMGEVNRLVLKDYALKYCMSRKSRNNHLNNEIYIHDLDSYAAGMHNCAARETKFCTAYDGVRSFEEYNDGDMVSVLTPNGSLKNAIVRKFGKQRLNKITFSLAGQRFVTERFTPNHRWILKDGSETTELKVGQQIYKAPVFVRKFNFDSATESEKYYWCLGFVLADGTEAYRWSHGIKNENIKFVRLRLCGDKIKYENRFSSIKHSTKELENGDLYLTFSSVIGFKKEMPLISEMTRGEKLALFDGLYCADGQQSGSRKSILTTNESIASFIEDEAPSLGWFILNINEKTGEDTNYKKRGFTKEFTFIGDLNKYFWTVVDIEDDSEEDVWCLVVEDEHAFVLPNGLTTGNCLSIPFDDLLSRGFNTRQTDVRPANSINTAMQLVAVIFQLQSLQQFGGVSATHLDWTMVPYVRKSFFKHFRDGSKYIECNGLDINDFNDGMSIVDELYLKFDKLYKYAMEQTEKELCQSVEGMYHNLNTLQSRSGNQLPFTSINYGTCTLPEGRMVTKAIIDGSISGVGKFHRTPIFPCGIFQMKSGVNRKEGEPNYDLFRLALKSTSQRLYPNYANCDWTGNVGYDENDPRTYFSTMGCRTANGMDINGFGQLKDGRGNICPVTIIMPTLAMQAKEKVSEKAKSEDRVFSNEEVVSQFMKILTKKIEEAKDMLIERFDWICSQSPASANFMWENNTMAGYVPEEGIRSALKHGTLVIGQLGLAETLQILIQTDHTTDSGMELAKNIEQLFNDKCKYYKETYKLNFGVYYTPAENLCYTAMNKFKDKYGVIENVSDREYFTNSIHVPVWVDMNPFEKIDIESQLTSYSNAGCITYVELPSTTKNNIDALEKIVQYAMDKNIPYFAINVPVDNCECGYSDEIGETCPMCGSKNIQRLRRVTGYLTGDYKTSFNKGKQAEVIDRVKHVKNFD